MRAPAAIFRVIAVAGIVQFATACARYSGFNPFDGDPGGPPPSPQLWDGAYGGDQGSNAYASAGYGEVSRRDSAPTERVTRAPSNAGSRDGNYGTDRVESAALPPPGEYAEAPRRPEPSYPQETESRGQADRTLTTTRGTAAAEATGAMHKVKSGEELSDVADAYGVREVDIIKANGLKPAAARYRFATSIFRGSMDFVPLRTSKCSCGDFTLPVCPARAITSPRATFSPRFTVSA